LGKAYMLSLPFGTAFALSNKYGAMTGCGAMSRDAAARCRIAR